jgi:UDP-N-acetyl-D-galactosamine dehydrogenase
MGLTFKENCPDLRNTRVVDIIAELKDYNCHVDIHDPWVSLEEAEHEYGIKLTIEPTEKSYDAIILAVAHQQFSKMGAAAIRSLGKDTSILYDLKYILTSDESDLRL